jgi:thioredoxin reductase
LIHVAYVAEFMTGKSESRRIAVLGAGPIGLEAALYARQLGFPVTIYERGQIGDHVRRWGHVRLFSPFAMNSTALGRATLRLAKLPGDADYTTGAEHLASYLTPLAQSDLLKDSLRAETLVIRIGRSGFLKNEAPGDPRRGQNPFHLLVRKGQEERIDEADIVLDCTGTYGTHRWLGDGGIPALGELAAETQICYGLDDVLGGRKGHYAGKSILLVGCGYSAATTASLLATLAEQHPETWVVWLARGQRRQPLPRIPNDSLKERDRLAARVNSLATRGDGNVEFHSQSVVRSISLNNNIFRITARTNGKDRTWEVDRLIANVGYVPDAALFRELQVHECFATQAPMGIATALQKQVGADCLTISCTGAAALRTTEPNFYILGAKSYGRNSQFLLRTGFEQIRDVFTLITGRSDLDLYRSTK